MYRQYGIDQELKTLTSLVSVAGLILTPLAPVAMVLKHLTSVAAVLYTAVFSMVQMMT